MMKYALDITNELHLIVFALPLLIYHPYSSAYVFVIQVVHAGKLFLYDEVIIRPDHHRHQL